MMKHTTWNDDYYYSYPLSKEDELGREDDPTDEDEEFSDDSFEEDDNEGY